LLEFRHHPSQDEGLGVWDRCVLVHAVSGNPSRVPKVPRLGPCTQIHMGWKKREQLIAELLNG
jgi:hypothetical protein